MKGDKTKNDKDGHIADECEELKEMSRIV